MNGPIRRLYGSTLLVSESAMYVRPWKAPSKAMTAGRPVGAPPPARQVDGAAPVGAPEERPLPARGKSRHLPGDRVRHHARLAVHQLPGAVSREVQTFLSHDALLEQCLRCAAGRPR